METTNPQLDKITKIFDKLTIPTSLELYQQIGDYLHKRVVAKAKEKGDEMSELNAAAEKLKPE